jgi:hypothetical protein
MSKKLPGIVRVSDADVEAIASRVTPEMLARLDTMTDEDIAAQIAANPDAAPELTDEWFANARLVIPLKKFVAE